MPTTKSRKVKNPNSIFWRNKADNLWKKVIKQVGACEVCNHKDRQLHAHHIITRVRLRFRHDVSNGVCLCSYCHAFDPSISTHVDSYGAEKFLHWLKLNRSGQFKWYEENKDDKRRPEKTYKESYEELLKIARK